MVNIDPRSKVKVTRFSISVPRLYMKLHNKFSVPSSSSSRDIRDGYKRFWADRRMDRQTYDSNFV